MSDVSHISCLILSITLQRSRSASVLFMVVCICLMIIRWAL